MPNPRALILTGFGINCEFETAHALELGGARPEFVHFNQLQAKPDVLSEYQMFVLPGGFSFGDDIQSGRVLANKFRSRLRKPLEQFVDSGKPVVGICNGFQTLVQLGVLPGWDNWGDRALTLMQNASGKFEDRWVRLRTEASVCKFAQNSEFFTMPTRHGEGQIALARKAVMEKLEEQNQIVFRYASSRDGLKADSYPDNPNGSADAIAGLCNPAGNVLGLMPHPECHVRYEQSPQWTLNPPHLRKESGLFASLGRRLGISKEEPSDEGNCKPFFNNLAAHAKRFM